MNWSNLKQLLNTIIGAYTPISIGEQYFIDYPYIISGILFIVIVYWFLKYIYRMFSND